MLRRMITADEARLQMDSPAFWERARRWCLLRCMPWLQLNGSRACGAAYLRCLRRHDQGDADEGLIAAVGLLHEHVGQQLRDAAAERTPYGARNYTVALFVHLDDGHDSLRRISIQGRIPDGVAERVAALQSEVLAHLATRQDDNDTFAGLAWVKSPACWWELVG